MPSRRDFILQTAAAGGVLAVAGPQAGSAGAAKPLRILILGATGFIGPHFVPAAIARGHKVSVFVWKRATEQTPLPSQVEQLLGDRNDDLESVKNRDWDAVLDLATYGPAWVRSLGEALRERVKHYTFISTISVYDRPAEQDITTETSRVQTYKGSADPYSLTSPGEHYGSLKFLCEGEAERQFPGRTLVLRPGYIVGPGDPQWYFTYWPVRMIQGKDKGGEMLVTGEPAAPVQFIDVRDLAEWAIRLVEKSVTGVYNTVGPAVPMRLDQLIDTSRRVTSSSVKLTWVPPSWLAGQRDNELWRKLLFWSSEGYIGTMRMSIERALAQGLTTRAVRVTLADTLAWYQQLPAEDRAALATGGKKTTPWSDYLAREKEILAAWHAQHNGHIGGGLEERVA